MNLQCAFKALFFSMFFLFCQQGLANDSYNLEKFRQQYKKNSERASNPKNRAHHSYTNPLKNIRIGFFGLNLESDDLSGDDRLQVYDDFVLHEEDFTHLSNFFFSYVNLGGTQNRHACIQRILTLMFRIFTLNITTNNSPENQKNIRAMAKSLFDKLFLSESINGVSNPFYQYFSSISAESPSDHTPIDNNLVLIFFAFLGPHFLSMDGFHDHFAVLLNRFTRISYHQALSNSLLPGIISRYQTPESFARQLKAGNLDTETALLIGLCALASASQLYIRLNVSWPETLEELLQRFVPYELLYISYENMMAELYGRRRLHPMPEIMISHAGMQAFTFAILGIDPVIPDLWTRPFFAGAESEASGPSNSSSQDSDSEWSLSDSEDTDEEDMEEAGAVGGAVGGATGRNQTCTVCSGSQNRNILLENCKRLGICEVCIENLLKE